MFMNAKKVTDIEAQKKNPIRASVDFFGALKRELRTITWTSRSDLRKYTKVIVLSMLLSGFLVYFADLGIQRILNGISLLTRMTFG
ncbi:MAG: Protein translocase subunit SecE [Chlamydiae bacterium]|nr:Protein translocase subunit SecE [Chlamydiota bacterium]